MRSHNIDKDNVKSLLVKGLQLLLVYKHRYKSRKALSKLDDRMLKDIGVTSDQVIQETKKPFWKGDSVVFDRNEYSKLTKRLFHVKTSVEF